MKAVLTIEMPESCIKCEYCGYKESDEKQRVCLFMSSAWPLEGNLHKRHNFCPLRPLPKKEEKPIKGEDDYNDFCIGYTRGWNECLEEITGEYE